MRNPLNVPGWLAFKCKSILISNHSERYFDKKPTIMIDGGLGSQMMGWIKYQIARELWADKKIQLDLSYFLQSPALEIAPGTLKRKWELEYYGIPLSDLYPERKPFFGDISYEKRAQFESPLFNEMGKRKWNYLFPLPQSTQLILKNLNLDSDFGVVHLRRGDYLQVASKIVQESEVIKLLEKINGFIPQTLIVLSDSDITDQNLNRIKKAANVSSIEKIIGGDMHAVHGLMRESKILIASNSTFSISAALTMTRGGTTIFPANFYGSQMPNLNTNFNSLADWHLHGDFLSNN